MAGPGKTTGTAKRKPAAAKPAPRSAPKPAPKSAPKPVDPRDALSLADLARGILSKDIRSRAQDVQRLAEAVLAGGGKPKKAGKKADGGKNKDKSKKKLAKIPGQSKK